MFSIKFKAVRRASALHEEKYERTLKKTHTYSCTPLPSFSPSALSDKRIESVTGSVADPDP
jgi:hypothetical protein